MQSRTSSCGPAHGSSLGFLALRYRSWFLPVPASPPWFAPGSSLALPVLATAIPVDVSPVMTRGSPPLVPDPLDLPELHAYGLPVWASSLSWTLLSSCLPWPSASSLVTVFPSVTCPSALSSSSAPVVAFNMWMVTLPTSGWVYNPVLSAPGLPPSAFLTVFRPGRSRSPLPPVGRFITFSLQCYCRPSDPLTLRSTKINPVSNYGYLKNAIPNYQTSVSLPCRAVDRAEASAPGDCSVRPLTHVHIRVVSPIEA